MGGSQGTTTTTQSNIPFNSSQILDVQNKAVDLSNSDPFQYYPGQTFAPANANQNFAFTDLGNLGVASGQATAPLVPGAQTTAINSNNSLAGGAGVAAAQPTINNLTALGSANPSAGGMNALSPIAYGAGFGGAMPFLSGLTNLTSGTAANDLASTAGGAYLGANPYLDSQFGAASDQLTRAYQTATAPQTDSAMEAAGRFGSGANSNAQSVNQANLGNSLANLGANLYGTAYTNERGLMNSAASSLGSLDTNALAQAGNLFGNTLNTTTNAGTNLAAAGATGQNSQTSADNAALANYASLLTGQQNAINATPNVTAMPTTDFTNANLAGGWQQAQEQAALQDQMNRFYGEQQAPWTTLQQEGQIIGTAIPGLTTTQTPYYTNPLGQALGAAGSVAKAVPLLGGK
ncbi:MAG TPA: hypothetical protein VHY35_10445 [Stellaceae bacterium]|jgi:hypothetical protein|nr:hypothetical protein [Stellaceae bacterium]